ncbi:MOSC domain-containing protein [Paenibacillus barcinonensis]|uniref:MOSC domain-containing protein n=1 Tax=Paenibacillus barcinonensis TaxID=198119 RepID=A0A2V4VU60_PAEBA|nr:MOSC domain-containing protein [Paenibacillus barcinonensis]PYE42385.1 MOSC domain-containing protein [Paenibacillus barcinonensis]QKS58089.1 MOSC domain-containing protein [Paenibacillus barcinonensis]
MGTVQFVLLAADPSTFETRAVPFIDIELAGIPGDRHYGLLRPADSRQKIYKRGTMIANRRQISMISEEECTLIAEKMKIPEVRPEWLGANILVRGIERLTELPAGTRFLFPDGTGLICEGENLPCVHPGKVIEQFYGLDGLRKKFVPAARKKRGIVCSVEREGVINTGDTIEVVRLP